MPRGPVFLASSWPSAGGREAAERPPWCLPDLRRQAVTGAPGGGASTRCLAAAMSRKGGLGGARRMVRGGHVARSEARFELLSQAGLGGLFGVSWAVPR
jgi:hypothetical protein